MTRTMRRPELPALTGVRFYAAILVYLSHVTLLPGMEVLSGRPSHLQRRCRRRLFLLRLKRVHPHIQLRGRSSATAVERADYVRFVWDRFTKIYPVHVLALLHSYCRVAVFQSQPAARLACVARARPAPAVLLAIVDSALLRLSERTVVEHQLRMVLLSPGAGVDLHRARAPTWLDPDHRHRGLRRFSDGSLWSGASDYSRLYHVSWFAPSRTPEFLVGVFLGGHSSRGNGCGSARIDPRAAHRNPHPLPPAPSIGSRLPGRSGAGYSTCLDPRCWCGVLPAAAAPSSGI